NLQLAWSRTMPPGRQYTTPLVHNGVMYLVSPGDVIQALDARSGDLIWEYRRPARRATLERAAADAPESRPSPPARVDIRGVRNMAIYGDKIFHMTADAHIIALSAINGALVWDVAETGPGIHHSAGPFVAAGKVITGRSAAATGRPNIGYIAA